MVVDGVAAALLPSELVAPGSAASIISPMRSGFTANGGATSSASATAPLPLLLCGECCGGGEVEEAMETDVMAAGVVTVIWDDNDDARAPADDCRDDVVDVSV